MTESPQLANMMPEQKADTIEAILLGQIPDFGINIKDINAYYDIRGMQGRPVLSEDETVYCPEPLMTKRRRIAERQLRDQMNAAHMQKLQQERGAFEQEVAAILAAADEQEKLEQEKGIVVETLDPSIPAYNTIIGGTPMAQDMFFNQQQMPLYGNPMLYPQQSQQQYPQTFASQQVSQPLAANPTMGFANAGYNQGNLGMNYNPYQYVPGRISPPTVVRGEDPLGYNAAVQQTPYYGSYAQPQTYPAQPAYNLGGYGGAAAYQQMMNQYNMGYYMSAPMFTDPNVPIETKVLTSKIAEMGLKTQIENATGYQAPDYSGGYTSYNQMPVQYSGQFSNLINPNATVSGGVIPPSTINMAMPSYSYQYANPMGYVSMYMNSMEYQTYQNQLMEQDVKARAYLNNIFTPVQPVQAPPALTFEQLKRMAAEQLKAEKNFDLDQMIKDPTYVPRHEYTEDEYYAKMYPVMMAEITPSYQALAADYNKSMQTARAEAMTSEQFAQKYPNDMTIADLCNNIYPLLHWDNVNQDYLDKARNGAVYYNADQYRERLGTEQSYMNLQTLNTPKRVYNPITRTYSIEQPLSSSYKTYYSDRQAAFAQSARRRYS